MQTTRGFSVYYRNPGPGHLTRPMTKDSRHYAEIVVGSYLDSGATVADFLLRFESVGLTQSLVDMRLCAYDDALEFLGQCSDLLAALVPLKNRCTVESVRGVLLGLGFVEFGA